MKNKIAKGQKVRVFERLISLHEYTWGSPFTIIGTDNSNRVLARDKNGNERIFDKNVHKIVKIQN